MDAALGQIAEEALARAQRRIRHRQGCRNRTPWSTEDIELLCSRYPEEATEAIALDLGRPISQVYGKARHLGLRKSVEFMASHLARHLDGSQGVEHRFRKGVKPWNTGLKGQTIGRMAETQFRPGSKPFNWLPIGSLRTTQDGYLQKKVTDTGYSPKDWVGVHILLWIEHNGPVPEKHCVIFKDGNRTNVVLENLELVSRAERMRRNSIHRYPPELKDAIRAVGRLKQAIREAEHEKQD
ncbi:hypothetical protein WP8S17C03_23050 [Metapseudomonas otitidis]|uniref:HNH nuclease domain-containing protein n=1 Tax=Metapseudomonas otitidis TaxID=319939 RepID=A0A6S5RVW5_9GAMM|nr:HNH endonuclease signature motif containing protein [Pseudomonas otitidis]BBT16256.1 hypothetical protein WP8S17C03_23050 [Pseudomonas otitidis]